MESVLGGDQFLGRDGKRLGRADQIGFVIGEKFERRGKDHGIAQPGAQRIGIEPGQFKVARGAILAFQHPAERGERENLRVGGLGCGTMRDCPVLRQGVIGEHGWQIGAFSDKADHGCRGQ